MRKISRLSFAAFFVVFLVFPAFPQVQQEQVHPTPFGFEMGMTKAAIVKIVGPKAVEKDDGDALVLSTAPAPHPDFEQYVVFVSPTQGVLKVGALSKTLDVNDEGEELQTEFDAIYDSLVAKYGPGKKIDFVRGDEEVNGKEEFWMMTLLHGERTLEALWNYSTEPGSPIGGDTVTGISLEAAAMSINSGYVKIFYEFPGWNAYVEAQKTKHGTVF